jgi:hypothetical protein
MTENRVLMLNEKINNLRFGHKADAERRLDTLEKEITDLETDFQKISSKFTDSHFELKHLVQFL